MTGKKYDIIKYLEDNSPNYKSTLKTYDSSQGKSIYKDLNTWYEIRHLLEESWKESGGEIIEDVRGGSYGKEKGNENVWRRLVGLDKLISWRDFGCFFRRCEPSDCCRIKR